MQTQNSNSNEIQTRLLDTHEDLHSPSKKEESSSIQTENLQEFSTFKQLNIANAPTTLLETIEALENEEAKLPDRKVLIKQMLNFFEKTTNQDCSIVTRISSICVSNQRILELLQILLCNSNQELRALTLLSSVDPEQFSDYEDCIFIAADYFSKNIKKFELLMNIISTTAENGLKGIYPLFSVTLRKLVKINCINEAMQFIDKLISNSIEISNCAINILIDNLCKGNRIEEAQTLLSRLEEYKPEHTFLSGNTNMEFSKLNVNCGVNITTWVIFLKNLFKNQKINLGILYYKKLIQQETFQCDQIFNIVIDGLFKNSKLEEIISVYNDMNIYEVKPSVATFNYIIESLIKNSEIDKAWEYYQRLLDTNQSGDNYTYSTLFRGIRDHSHKVYLQKAFEILDNMTNEGKRIEIILINVLLDSCVFLKEGKIIQNFFKKITTGYYRVEPDTVTLNTYLKGCIHTGYFNEAFMEFENLIDRIPPNDVTFNTILDACVRDNKMNKVNFVMSLMQSHKIKPDNFTYSTIIKGLNKTYESNEKDLQLAFDMFENVKKFSTPDEIFYNCMMDVCLRFDRIDKMLEIYEEMKSKQIKPSSITCGIAIKAYGMNNELDKAIEVYNMMKLNNIERSSVTYGCLINSCIKNNNLEKVFELYNEMDKLGYEMNTILYTTLIKAYAKVKNTKKVFEIFNKMKKDEKNPPNNITFNTVLDYSSKNLDLESSLRIFEEIVNFKNVQPDIISFSTLVKCYINNKCLDKAIDLIYQMKDFNLKPDEVLINSLLDGCEKSQNFDAANKIFEYIKTLKVNIPAMAFSIMMKVYGKLGDFEKSKCMLNEMKSLNKNLSLIIYTCYLKTCFTTKNFNESVAIYEEMRSKDIKFDKVTFNTLIRGFISGKLIKLLKDVVTESVERKVVLNDDPLIYSKIHKCFIYDKKFNYFADEYLNLVSKIGVKRNIKTGQFFYSNNVDLHTEDCGDEDKSNYLISGYKFKQKQNNTVRESSNNNTYYSNCNNYHGNNYKANNTNTITSNSNIYSDNNLRDSKEFKEFKEFKESKEFKEFKDVKQVIQEQAIFKDSYPNNTNSSQNNSENKIKKTNSNNNNENFILKDKNNNNNPNIKSNNYTNFVDGGSNKKEKKYYQNNKYEDPNSFKIVKSSNYIKKDSNSSASARLNDENMNWGNTNSQK